MVCKSIDGLLLFNDDKDYFIYQERLRKFTGNFMQVWSFCLLNNHSHHIIKINSVAEIAERINIIGKDLRTTAMWSFLENRNNDEAFDCMIERQMNSFLVSYANYYNNKYNRKGGLFQKPFKRIAIEDDSYLQQAIIYTHANPQKHRLTTNFKNYKHSSYEGIRNGSQLHIPTNDVIDFFGWIEKI